ncbi:MAG: 4Fe-4S binding protein [Elusimicrobia bacterium]|nr:4Fe-4S binding protein [Elusimicrobiota bacterium]
MAKKPDLSVEFCGKTFLNPFLLSSSPVSNSALMVEKSFEAGWAGVAYKTVVADNAPIIHPSTSDRGLKPNMRDIAYLKKRWPKHVVIGSIMGFRNEEWAELAVACTDAGADMLELNFSCPHMTVEGSGAKVGQTDHLVEKFTTTVRKVTRLPLIAKMTPNLADMNEPAMAAKRGGADAISAINTVRGISEVGLEDFVPKPNVFGKGAISGYSGPAVKPIGLRFIAEMAKNKELNLPLSGIGGIQTWDMIEGLTDYMALHNVKRVKDLVGKALPHLCETGDFDLKRQGISSYDLDKCVGCGQCYVVCRDSGGQALEWNEKKRRPELNEDKCLSCMVCSFVCPVDGLITFKEMPADWKRRETVTLG